MSSPARIKYLADMMAMKYAARSIPTGELYRGIAESQYAAARQELIEAIDEYTASFDVVGLAEEQRKLPSPFGDKVGHIT